MVGHLLSYGTILTPRTEMSYQRRIIHSSTSRLFRDLAQVRIDCLTAKGTTMEEPGIEEEVEWQKEKIRVRMAVSRLV
jgi:hypothetical protein